jgi:hypothetical protein
MEKMSKRKKMYTALICSAFSARKPVQTSKENWQTCLKTGRKKLKAFSSRKQKHLKVFLFTVHS